LIQNCIQNYLEKKSFSSLKYVEIMGIPIKYKLIAIE